MTKIGYQIFIEVYKKDKENDKYKKVYEYFREGQSFTYSFFAMIRSWHSNLIKFYNKDGTLINLTWPEYGGEYLSEISVLAPADNDNFGIIIGKSEKSFNRRDYWLGDQYKNNIFKHYEVNVETEADHFVEYSRRFENITGSTQQVKEIGLVYRIESSEATYYSLFARDVIVPINVDPNSILIVKYRIECE